MLSDVGGLYSIVFALFQLIVFQINDKKWIAKQIRNFFVQAKNTNRGTKFNKIRIKVSNMINRSNEGAMHKEFYAKGKAKLFKSLDIFRLFQSIQKIVAATTILIERLPDKETVLSKVNTLNKLTKTIWLDIQNEQKQAIHRDWQEYLETYQYFENLDDFDESEIDETEQIDQTINSQIPMIQLAALEEMKNDGNQNGETGGSTAKNNATRSQTNRNVSRNNENIFTFIRQADNTVDELASNVSHVSMPEQEIVIRNVTSQEEDWVLSA